jgi:phosphoribosyl 1,2-cyclic phosphodiesterase
MLWKVPAQENALRIRFWGVRGSVCASGPQFAEFGGHTPCVEIRCGSRLVVVDAGTGLAPLGAQLIREPQAEIDIFFSHLHLDHVSGLPFFKPALRPGQVLRTWCGNLGGASAKDALDRMFSPPLFPVRLDQLPGTFEHHGFRAGETLRLPDGLTVKTHLLQHPGGSTGYRFDHGGRAICYISDIEHSHPWPSPDLIAFVEGADLVVYDGMFSEEEYCSCVGWGHSTWQKGVALAKAADVKSLAVFHLHPAHDDEHLRHVEAALKAEMPTAFIARQGQELVFSRTV